MDAEAWLGAPVTEVDGVGPRVARLLERSFSIHTVRDLIEHYPSQEEGKYRDVGAVMPLSDARIGQAITLVGHIRSWQMMRPRGRRLVIAKAAVVDEQGGGVIEAPFFNQEWRPRQTPEGTRVAVSGVLERFRGRLQLKQPQLTLLADDETVGEAERIRPTYPATEALPSHRIARLVAAALDRLPPVPDYLPPDLREQGGLVDLDTALRQIHRPTSFEETGQARQRLVYDELLCLQVGLQQRRHRLEADTVGLAQAPRSDGLAARFLDTLPFPPTGAQRRAFAELGADLERPKPMHRLLQGDVGSGKTLVAAWAMLAIADHERQAALMAPTEVLAEQHFRTLSQLLAPLGVNVLDGPRLELVTASTPAKRLRGVLAELATGQVQLVIGTHALLEERVQFADLGLAVVDEQHRFGVEHRTRLRDKRGDDRSPDVLVMTATPIPRSLALTVYGDLDVTVLDELPPGRQPIATEVIPSGSARRRKLEAFIRERVSAGERAYWVCPLITESDALGEEVADAVGTHRRLSEETFADFEVGLVHGRLTPGERDEVMEAFRAGGVQILVATTVIEVGVDVAEATVMVIEDADRFGISQLHQLRGRVGRGRARSWCVLFSRGIDEAGAGNPRLEALRSERDGFRLAEIDLELRGEGSLFDTRQSGLPDLKLARLVRDQAWVARSREDARALVSADPALAGQPLLAREVRRRYGEQRLAALETG